MHDVWPVGFVMADRQNGCSRAQVKHKWNMIGVMTLRINYLNLPIVLPIVLSIVAAALLASQPASAQRYADLESCELAAGGGRLTVTARCGPLSRLPKTRTTPTLAGSN